MLNWTAIILRNSNIDKIKCCENLDSFTDVSFFRQNEKINKSQHCLFNDIRRKCYFEYLSFSFDYDEKSQIKK